MCSAQHDSRIYILNPQILSNYPLGLSYLNIETFLHFGVWSHPHMEYNDSQEQQIQTFRKYNDKINAKYLLNKT